MQEYQLERIRKSWSVEINSEEGTEFHEFYTIQYLNELINLGINFCNNKIIYIFLEYFYSREYRDGFIVSESHPDYPITSESVCSLFMENERYSKFVYQAAESILFTYWNNR